jgi:hypothetical protein
LFNSATLQIDNIEPLAQCILAVLEATIIKPMEEIICDRCNIPLSNQEIALSYMGYEFKANVLHCPRCGQPYVDEELARGRMMEVECALEDK